MKQKMKGSIYVAAIALLFVIDLWGVGRRALDAENFKEAKKIANPFPLAPAQQKVYDEDKSYYRVFDLTGDPFNEAKTSYYFKHIGGYHPAKLALYQDLIENQIAKNNMQVLNMLNTKYFFNQDKNTGEVYVQQNPMANGPAWFVSNIQLAANADEEMKALEKFDSKRTAIIDKRYESQLTDVKAMIGNASADSIPMSAAISFKEYKPNKLSYTSKTDKPMLAVFSEMWYKGNEDWKSYVDGKEVPHMRANYALRAMVVPAGSHEIVFQFMPHSYASSERISMIASAIVLLLVFAALALAIWQEIKADNSTAPVAQQK